MSDGTRTRDILDHNQTLYQLSYTHQVFEPPWRLQAGQKHSRSGRGRRFGVAGPTPGRSTGDYCTVWRAPADLAVTLSGPGGGTKSVSR